MRHSRRQISMFKIEIYELYIAFDRPFLQFLQDFLPRHPLIFLNFEFMENDQRWLI